MAKASEPWNYWTPNESHLIYVDGDESSFERMQQISNGIFGRCILCPELLLFEYHETTPIGRLILLCPACRDRFIGNSYRKN